MPVQVPCSKGSYELGTLDRWALKAYLFKRCKMSLFLGHELVKFLYISR